MHYRNGREAKNGYGAARINAVGVLHSAVAGI